MKTVYVSELRSPLLVGMIERMTQGEWRELRESVAKHGVRVPILVRRDEADGTYEVLDGLRRVAAAVLAGQQELPAVEVPADADVPPVAWTLIANAVRSPNPIAEYRAIKALVERGLTHEQIAELLGVHRSTVTTRLRLDRVHPGLLVEAEKGRVPYSVLRRLPSYGREVQEAVLERVRRGERVRVKDLEELRSAGPVTPVLPLEELAERAGERVDAIEVEDLRERARSRLAALREALDDLGLLDEEGVTDAIEQIRAALARVP